MSVDKRIEEELFPFYALGSLTDAEQAEVEAYIAANPEARKRLEEWQEVTAAIPFTVEPVNPSPGVWQGLKERIDATQPSPQPAISVMDVVAGWFGRFRASLAMPILSGVSVLVAIIAIVSMVLLQAQVEKQRRVLEMIQAPGVITIGIGDVTGEHPEAVGLLALKPETETAVFFTTDLEPLTVDETYQLWILRDEAALSAGIFNVNEQGIGVLEVSEATINLVDLFDTSFDAVGVSIEPAGGSEQPTRVIMLGAASY